MAHNVTFAVTSRVLEHVFVRNQQLVRVESQSLIATITSGDLRLLIEVNYFLLVTN